MSGPVLSVGDLWALVIATMLWLAVVWVFSLAVAFCQAPLRDVDEQGTTS